MSLNSTVSDWSILAVKLQVLEDAKIGWTKWVHPRACLKKINSLVLAHNSVSIPRYTIAKYVVWCWILHAIALALQDNIIVFLWYIYLRSDLAASEEPHLENNKMPNGAIAAAQWGDFPIDLVDNQAIRSLTGVWEYNLYFWHLWWSYV